MVRRVLALAALASVCAVAPAHGAPRPAPTGLKAFLLRADEPAADTFPRTPSFAWTPYKGALSYDFELATSQSFDQSTIVWSSRATATALRTPVVAVPVSLPWLTGKPHALYAHVRARTRGGLTQWSTPFGFDMRWKSVPEEITPDVPGLVRWQPVEGATSYDVWFLDAGKVISTVTNVADEREYYTFHQDPLWTAQVQWRVRAVRRISGALPGGLPAVVYGPWSSTFTSSNADLTPGPLTADTAVSDAVSTASAPAALALTPGYSFSGNESLAGASSNLYRVYVSTDADCVDTVFTGSVVGSPAYAPRITGSLALPATVSDESDAEAAYATDGAQTGTFTADYAPIVTSEQAPATTAPAAGSSEFSATGALVDLPESGWPTGRFYWTVVPVDEVTVGSTIRYYDAEVPQDACAAGRVVAFGKTGSPVTASGKRPFVTGLSPDGALVSAAGGAPKVYGTPLVAWEPVLGAAGYEVQWSRTSDPWKPAGKAITTAATSTLIDGLRPGTWYYRVRAIDPYVAGAAKQTAWSAPAQLTVARPKYAVLGG